jgi:exonuclease III
VLTLSVAVLLLLICCSRVIYVMILAQPLNILGWNVRGLNDLDRRDTVHETIASSSCQLVCLQETKLAAVTSLEAAYIGGYRLKNFAERPANGTRGGILLL